MIRNEARQLAERGALSQQPIYALCNDIPVPK
jgi:hypothetical protein